jgi:AraC-like DNA-binding protein
MNSNKFFYRLFVTVGLCFAIPSCFLVVIFNIYTVKYSQHEIAETAMTKLHMSKKAYDQIFDTLSKDGLKLALNEEIKELTTIENYESAINNRDHMLNALDIITVLQKYGSTNDMIFSIYIYEKDKDFVITTNNGIGNIERYYDKDWLMFYQNYLIQDESRYIIPPHALQDAAGQVRKYVLTYISPITLYTNSFQGVLVININYNQFCKMIDQDGLNNQNRFLQTIDKEGNVMFDSRAVLFSEPIKEEYYYNKILETDNTEGYFTYDDNNRLIICNYMKENDLIYISFDSMDTLMSNMNQMRLIYICVTLFLVGIGILLSYIILNRTLHPVRELMLEISNKKKIDLKKGENELAVLSKVFQDLMREDSKLFSTGKSKNHEYMLDKTLMNCIIGEREGTEEYEEYLNFHYSGFRVIIIDIDNYYNTLKLQKKDQQKVSLAVLSNLAKELLEQEFVCRYTIAEKRRVILVVNYDKDREAKQFICNKLNEMKTILYKISDYTVSISIGRKVVFNELYISYKDALEALNYRIMLGYDSLIISDDIEIQVGQYYYPVAQEKYIFHCLETGDSECACKAVDDMIFELKNQSLDYYNVVQILNQQITNILKYLIERKSDIGSIFDSGESLYNTMSEFELLEDIAAWLKKLYTQIIEYNFSNENKNIGYLKLAYEFIDQNYTKDIDINVVAEHVGISYSYLRRIFKEENGESITTYIASLRIEKAKELLQNTSHIIKEIALQCGYTNEQTFSRMFQKVEDITPGKYRENIRNTRK